MDTPSKPAEQVRHLLSDFARSINPIQTGGKIMPTTLLFTTCLPQHRLQSFRRLRKVSFESLTFITLILSTYDFQWSTNDNYWNWSWIDIEITIVLTFYDYVSIIVYFSLKFVPKPVDKHWKSILLIYLII